jgi:hypothetical protein
VIELREALDAHLKRVVALHTVVDVLIEKGSCQLIQFVIPSL